MRLTYAQLQELVRRRVLLGKNPSVAENGSFRQLHDEGGELGAFNEKLPQRPIVGCDLKNYSGMLDVEQFIFGQLLDRYVVSALQFSETPFSGVELSGTGDGVLIGFKEENNLGAALLCALRLWAETQECVRGSDGKTRGLRVAVGYGPCLFGSAFDGQIKMQGFGLIDVSRILNCDKEQHLLVSSRFLQKLEDAFPGGVVLKSGLTVRLQLGPQRSGKCKPADAEATQFFNIVAEVQPSSGAGFRAGDASEAGLHTPGAT